MSIDSALTDAGTRGSNPVVCGTNSFEKHLRLKLDVAPATRIENILWWTDGTPTANVALRAKEAVGAGGATPGTGDATPSATAMTGDIDAYSRTSGSKGTWDGTAGGYATLNNVTKALLLQLQPAAGATPGTWPQETVNYSYDES
jgi:hypothetical protein